MARRLILRRENIRALGILGFRTAVMLACIAPVARRGGKTKTGHRHHWNHQQPHELDPQYVSHDRDDAGDPVLGDYGVFPNGARFGEVAPAHVLLGDDPTGDFAQVAWSGSATAVVSGKATSRERMVGYPRRRASRCA